MKITNLLYTLLSLAFTTSCTYNYITPDMSNATLHSNISYEYFVTWDMDLTLFIIEDTYRLGYEGWSDMIITEKDQKGNILFHGKKSHGTIESHCGAKTIEVGIERTGWPKGFHGIGKEVKIGVYHFGPFNLEEIAGKEFILTKNTPFTFENLLHEADRFLYNVTLGDDVRNKLVEIAESLGYKYGNYDILMTEIDKDGFRYPTKYWSSVDEYYYSRDGAIKLEIVIKLYGYRSYNFYELGILKFDELILLKDIANKNIMLTLNMPYTFIKKTNM